MSGPCRKTISDASWTRSSPGSGSRGSWWSFMRGQRGEGGLPIIRQHLRGRLPIALALAEAQRQHSPILGTPHCGCFLSASSR